MREITLIVWHCTATPVTMKVNMALIRKWHVDENGWSDVGYHYLIRRDGTLETGRSLEKPGAHASGYNKESIGVAFEGGTDKFGKSESNFSRAQYECAFALKDDLDARYNNPEHKGHNEISSKECPSLNIRALF